ncbi:MAG: DUF6531 domain-containing protein, partial [Pseudomonadota bacterium]|nr:DUF6531 domain-containing protein [Pseudomonadota bacterium]
MKEKIKILKGVDVSMRWMFSIVASLLWRVLAAPFGLQSGNKCLLRARKLFLCFLLALLAIPVLLIGKAQAADGLVNDSTLNESTACAGSSYPKLVFHQLGYNPITNVLYYPARNAMNAGPDWYYSQDYINLTSAGWKLVNNCVYPLSYWYPFTIITGGYFPSLYEYRQYRLVPPNNPETCEREGNPCDPVTGNKSQVEQDIVFGRSGNLNFTRFYNSLGDRNTSVSMAPGWRHTYSRGLNQGLSNNKITPDSIQSQNYASPSAACTQGWNDIKYQMWGGSLATSGVVEYTGNLLCRVRVANKTVAYLTIYVPLDVVPA